MVMGDQNSIVNPIKSLSEESRQVTEAPNQTSLLLLIPRQINSQNSLINAYGRKSRRTNCSNYMQIYANPLKSCM